MKATLDIIPCVSIHPDRICTFSEINWQPSKPSRQQYTIDGEIIQSNTERIIHSARCARGLVSPHARRKITKAIDYLLLMSTTKTHYVKTIRKKISFRIVFITLTLPSPQIHTDNEIKEKCLNSFLIEITRYHNVHNYLWRAEKQKNGNIHFHLIIDQFVLYNELRRRWNRICNKLGYVDRYTNRMKQFHINGFHFVKSEVNKYSYEQQLKAYKAGQACAWRSPNSTDIHSVKLINDVKAYISKYATKEPILPENASESEKKTLLVDGRIWGCNQELSNIKGARSYVDAEIESAITDTIKNTGCKIYRDTYFSIYYLTIDQLREFSPECLFAMFADYMSSHFNYSMQLSIPIS